MPPFVPGIVPVTNWVCPKDKLGFYCVTQGESWVCPGDKVVVPGTNRVCPWDNPRVVPRATGPNSLCLCVDVPRPTRICRALYLCLRRKNKKFPKFVRYFSAIFPLFRNSWKIQKPRPNPSAQKFILRKTRGFISWISSEFVRFWENREK